MVSTSSSNESNSAPPIICISGFSGSGKTTLIVGLISHLTREGFRVGTIKHDVHGFNIDQPGKDSYRHKEAGASAAIITSPTRFAMVADTDEDRSPESYLPLMSGLDIVVAEGFKRAKLPKIEVFRPETGKGRACENDPYLIAMASNASLDTDVPRFPLDATRQIADFIIDRLKLQKKD
ncbi:MAG: molybdopterin-guanine dinucleotide biosynthesis protein B [Desulfobacteraceae bacterium]|nr:molybdopterin-guanine dinucleotide biosynthesis protein B [Desulfobacteraceae bacterium]